MLHLEGNTHLKKIAECSLMIINIQLCHFVFCLPMQAASQSAILQIEEMLRTSRKKKKTIFKQYECECFEIYGKETETQEQSIFSIFSLFCT